MQSTWQLRSLSSGRAARWISGSARMTAAGASSVNMTANSPIRVCDGAAAFVPQQSTPMAEGPDGQSRETRNKKADPLTSVVQPSHQPVNLGLVS